LRRFHRGCLAPAVQVKAGVPPIYVTLGVSPGFARHRIKNRIVFRDFQDGLEKEKKYRCFKLMQF
jgi:hypothetical protein